MEILQQNTNYKVILSKIYKRMMSIPKISRILDVIQFLRNKILINFKNSPNIRDFSVISSSKFQVELFYLKISDGTQFVFSPMPNCRGE